MKNRVAAFKYAMSGLVCFLKETYHARIHALAAGLVILIGFYTQINALEWCVVLLCIALVFGLEAVNSSIEYVVDLASPNYQELAKKAKDVAAAAVLIASIFAMIIAAIIFIPKILTP